MPGKSVVIARWGLWATAPVGLYASWLAMEAVHEAGHVLHAALSGGRVAHVELPWLGFSRTDLAVNPSPRFVAWGGPVWGAAAPLLVWLLWAAAFRRRGRWEQISGRALQFFAGFCLVANGAYLGVGWMDRAGDAGDLIRRGTPVGVLILFGAVATGAGLWLWHRLGLGPSRQRNAEEDPANQVNRQSRRA